MGIMSNTVSVYQYRVDGKPGNASWVQECLNKSRFVPIDTTSDEESAGWVTLDDHGMSDFDNENVFRRDPYYAFTLRRDQRKVPAAVLKGLVDRECSRWLAERPAISRMPYRRKAEIRENLHASLLGRTLPVPATYDVVWNAETGIVTVAGITEKVLDMVEDHFASTFDGLILEPIHPMARASGILDKDQRRLLEKADQAPSKDVLLQIKRNRWVGWDFLLWLMYRTGKGSSVYEVNQEGPLLKGEAFMAYVHDKFVLVAEHEQGKRRSAITGAQREFAEAREALRDGKNIVEALIYLEKEPRSWKISLKADIFAFGSFSCPVIQIERDEITDPFQERIAVFYERMSLMETGLQLFDSLFSAFMTERVSGTWPERLGYINEWLGAP
ncbi:MAG TPA: recombination-associated protein RdgC [Deltaproteobacteria bacterium]|nr:recombination-associated protein RdgC [Deltaproteobacteria bacterium]HPR54851.1 recombination-associated protein RdgC [Deltaproteobacteria bacterium]HXK46524.1 recombination-associated protein RdgC [Deltaproteobacteria bacterium]